MGFSIVLLDFAFGLSILYYISRIRRFPAPLPPGPKKTLLLGNIRDLPPAGKPEWVHWMKHKELYGPISSLSVLGQTIVIISDHKMAFDLLDKRNAIYSERPVMHFAGEMYGRRIIFVGPEELLIHFSFVRIGWELLLAPLAKVDERFRAYRKCIRQVIGSKVAITRFHTLQTVEARRFLFRVLDNPHKLEEHIRAEAGAIILKLCYGYSVEPKGSDPLIELADKAMSQSSIAMTPGKWLVDVIPSCKSPFGEQKRNDNNLILVKYLPEWLPGMRFKRIAKRWRRTLIEFTERPYAFTKSKMVRFLY